MTRTYGNVVVFPALLVFKIYVLFFSNFFQVYFIIFIFLQRRISVELSSISTGARSQEWQNWGLESARQGPTLMAIRELQEPEPQVRNRY